MLNVDVALKPKMHVYSPDQPKGQDYLPIALTVTEGDGFRLEKPRYPSSEKFFFAPLKETQHVYSKPFRITQPIVRDARQRQRAADDHRNGAVSGLRRCALLRPADGGGEVGAEN